ncbi:hypothetical protein T12_9440 [Trichinella patagoniensis]|uniref:Uncharacterized protein n=1 Tax=Trichinella patagoniensis TaxID=990121 RepID=A0A0V0ZBJ5_9BILA|nr:hypothetical protein T12_3742 [Trichinella patagoniensis]KRY13664.1 hypothetical protein T12_9440 [Trichinella patagoniensis]
MVVGCLYGPVSAVVLFDLLIVRLLVIGDVVVILLNLMIWHCNSWDKRSRTVVVPHTQDVHFGFFPITSELPDVEVLHCAFVSGGFAVIEVDRTFSHNWDSEKVHQVFGFVNNNNFVLDRSTAAAAALFLLNTFLLHYRSCFGLLEF